MIMFMQHVFVYSSSMKYFLIVKSSQINYSVM